MNRSGVVSLVIGIVGLLAAAVMGGILLADTGDEPTGDLGATGEGFVIEPAGSVGPDAFTPSVQVEDDTICDVNRFLAELTARPEALGEWSRVLGVSEDDVGTYVASLTPKVLDEDTAVTNHGLRDGTAYARPSMLPAGTAVLMGSVPGGGESTVAVPEQPVPPDTEPPQTQPPETQPTTTMSVPTTTPGEQVPVTRCRCGNPLLPPYAPASDGPEAPPSGTTTTTVPDVPEDDAPPPEDDAPPPDDVPPDDDIPDDDIPQDDLPPDDDDYYDPYASPARFRRTFDLVA